MGKQSGAPRTRIDWHLPAYSTELGGRNERERAERNVHRTVRRVPKTGTHPTGSANRSESQGGHNSRRKKPGSHTQPESRGPDKIGKGAHAHRTPLGKGAKSRKPFNVAQVHVADSVGLGGAWRG